MRRAFNIRRVGHTGTVDPFASGLLIVLVGRATRLAPYLVGLHKEYTGTIALGVTTTTDDRTGNTTTSSDMWRKLVDDDITRAMASLTGNYLQRPPAYSAKKIAGNRAHRLARRGETFTLEPHQVEVYRFDMVRRDRGFITFATEVSSGTYVRALARDLGEALECGAHLASLRRLRIGPFHVADAIALDALDAAANRLRPARDAVRHLATVELDEGLRAKVMHGRPVPDAGTGGEPVALVADGALVAIAERRGDVLKPTVVLEG